MKYVVDKENMRRCDQNTTIYFGIPELVLMERAALAVCDEVRQHFSTDANILIVCGSGNNGGDGFAIGRILYLMGFFVEFYFVGDEQRISDLCKKQMEIVQSYGRVIDTSLPEKKYDIIVDAIFGIGLSKMLSEDYENIIRKLNDSKAFKIAVDIPSGVDANTGCIMGSAFQADVTVTFGFLKQGLILYPGASFAGKVICRQIGITKESFLNEFPKGITYENKDLAIIPKRRPDGNKGSFGKLGLFAGSKSVSGACMLAAKAAFRSGCGYVKIYTHEANRGILSLSIPEAVLLVHTENTPYKEKLDLAKAAYQFADEVIIGPGIGFSDDMKKVVDYVLRQDQKVVIFDADALRILSESPLLIKYLEKTKESRKHKIIFTPHMGEIAGLLKAEIKEVKQHLMEWAPEFAKRLGIILVCKDARTVVFDGYSERIYFNRSGNEGMACAGSGDILTGMIAAMLGRKMEAFEAAAMGVFIHGICGDFTKKKVGSVYMTPSDMIEELSNILQ